MKILQLLFLGFFFLGGAYASDHSGLPSVPIPADNPQTTEKINLGRLLFNDKRFSGDGSISCANCHIPEKAFTDGLTVAKGINQQTGTRNSPTIVNAAFYTRLFLDGREASLEKQALGPFINPIEHGLKNHQPIVDIVRKDPSYLDQFSKVFGITAETITIDHVVKAIASFERTLIAGNSPFDEYFFNGKKSKLSQSASRGEKIFRRKGNCANCHEISWNHALFTDNQFYNIGVGFKRLQLVLDKFLAALAAGQNPDDFKLTDFQRSELGRFNVTKVIIDIGKFKTPTLRNIALTAPYMHDGSVQTLEEVVEYYDKGGEKNRFLDAAIFPLKLTSQEKKDLVAFMQSLTSPQFHKPQ